MANFSFLDYRMPTSLDLPMLETHIVEVANPMHPFGVRGVGEVPIAPPLGAIPNAINDAIGVRLQEQPMKPGRILEALAAKNGGKEPPVSVADGFLVGATLVVAPTCLLPLPTVNC